MRGMDLDEHDGALVIFTTGSTGYPKPALLSHRAITCQNMCLGAAFDFEKNPAHAGEPAALPRGRPDRTAHDRRFPGDAPPCCCTSSIRPSRWRPSRNTRSTAFGQIPALFNLEWRLPDYDSYDLSSLKFAL